MAIHNAVSGQPVKDNGATIPRGGNIDSSSTVTNAPDNVTQGAGSNGGTQPVASATLGTQAAVSGQAFARQDVAGQFVMRTYGFIHGAASNMLNSGASDFGRRAIHSKTNRRSYHITSWDYATGAATKGADTNDDFNDDHAATPTRAIPGEFTYTDRGIAKSGALAVPLNADYEAKQRKNAQR